MSAEFIAPSNFPEKPPENLTLESTLKELSVFNFQVESSYLAKDVARLFQAHPLLPGVILTENKNFLGMISRRRFMERMSRPYGVDIFACRPIMALYQIAQTDVLILPGVALIVMAAQRAVARLRAIDEEVDVALGIADGAGVHGRGRKLPAQRSRLVRHGLDRDDLAAAHHRHDRADMRADVDEGVAWPAEPDDQLGRQLVVDEGAKLLPGRAQQSEEIPGAGCDAPERGAYGHRQCQWLSPA